MKNFKRFSPWKSCSIIWILLLMGFNSFGTIELGNIIQPQNGCDGSFDLIIRADEGYKLAAPFEVEIIHKYESFGQEIEEVFFPKTIIPESGLPKHFDGICIGSYIFKITNHYGCSTEFTEPIMHCSETLTINLEELKPTSSGSLNTSLDLCNNIENDTKDGKISITSTIPDLEYSWSNGASGMTIEDLAAGVYTVTISSGTCIATETYTVEGCEYISYEKVEERCISSPGGASGNFCFPHFECIPVNNAAVDFEATIVGGLVEEDLLSRVELKVLIKENGASEFTEDIPEYYTFNWYYDEGAANDNDHTNSSYSFNAIDLGGKVSVTISNGCSNNDIQLAQRLLVCNKNYSRTEFADIFVDANKLVKPCGYRNPDGSVGGGLNDGTITLDVPMPDEESEVKVIVNGVPINVTLKNGYGSAEIDGLAPGEQEISIIIGNCQFSNIYFLNPRATDKEFVKYDDDKDQCVYNESCGEVYNDVYYESPFVEDNNVGDPNGWGNCFVPIACRDDWKGEKKVRRVIKKIWEWKAIVTAAHSDQAISSALFDRIKLTSEWESHQECQEIKFCPYSYLPENTFSPIDDNCAIVEGIIPNGVGCVKVLCSCRGDIDKFCLIDVNIEGFRPSEDVINCQPIEKNLYELWLNLEYLKATINNFEQTQLYGFIVDNGHLKEAKCANVIYCTSDYDIKNHDNLLTIDCDPLENFGPDGEKETFPTCAVLPSDLFGDNYIQCWKKNCYSNDISCLDLIKVNPYTSRGNNFNNGDQRIEDKFFLDTFYNEKLISFGKVTDEDSAIPKGFLQSENDYIMYDYDALGIKVEKKYSHKILFLENDFVIDKSILIAETKDQKENIFHYEHFNETWYNTIHSDTLLLPKHLSEKDSNITIGGVYIDSLLIDSNLIDIVSNYAAYSLQYDLAGNLQSTTTIENLDTNLLFSENQNGEILFVSNYQGDTIIINGEDYLLPVKDGMVIGSIDANNQVEILQAIERQEEELLDIAFSSTGTQYTLVLGQAQQDSTSTEQALLLLTLEKTASTTSIRLDKNTLATTASVKYHHYLAAAPLMTEKMDMVYGEEDALMVGLTYKEELPLLGETLISQGQEDVALFKLDSTGTMVWHRSYGTADHENVSQLMYDNTVLFFGGEFNGDTRIRTLGNYRFINLSNSLQRAYISYIFDEVPVEVAARITPIAPVTQTEISDNTVKIFPNPFSNTFTIQYGALQTGITEIQITDMVGQQVHASRHEAQTGTNEIEIASLKDATGGIYYITINQVGEGKQSTHKVLHIR